MPGKNKTPLLGWHPPAELLAWFNAEVERRGGGRGVKSEILTEALETYCGTTTQVTDEMINRAWAVLREEIAPPYMAHVNDYVTEDSRGERREREIAALKEADQEADSRNRDLVRRALDAALME